MFSVLWIYAIFMMAVVYRVLGFIVWKKLCTTLTAMDDISLLGCSRKDGNRIRGTAIICGGSIAGLISARICSDHFENVLVIEPEAWLATQEGLRDCHRDGLTPKSGIPKRARIPQYNALQVHQCFTPLALRRLFPNFDSELSRAGARLVPDIMALHLSGIPILVPFHKYPEGLPTGLYFSRSGYETVLRKMTLSTCPNVKYITGSVTGLVSHKSSNAVAAVSVRLHPGEAACVEIPATLVVDCTGPARSGLRWLQDPSFLGDRSIDTEKDWGSLKELQESYDPRMAYTSCQFKMSSIHIEKIKATVTPWRYENLGNIYAYIPTPLEGNTLLISRREGDYLDMACGGWNFRGKMTSIADIQDYVSNLKPAEPIPGYVFSLLELLEAENVPCTFLHCRVSPAVYVQYLRAPRLPSNFVAVGDSVVQLNPVRGQGCAKACIEAVTLNALLARCDPVAPSQDSQIHGDNLPDNFSRRFFTLQRKRTGNLWYAQKMEDYSWPSTIPMSGEKLKTHGKWRRWYSSKVSALILKDPEVAYVFWHIFNFLAPSTDFFSPGIVAKVLWLQIKQMLSRGNFK